MARGPTPDEIFDRAVAKGQRRIDQSLLELVSTSFMTGFTIVCGLIGLGIVESFLEPVSHGVARLGGAHAFGVGVVFGEQCNVGPEDVLNEREVTRLRAIAVDDRRLVVHPPGDKIRDSHIRAHSRPGDGEIAKGGDGEIVHLTV